MSTHAPTLRRPAEPRRTATVPTTPRARRPTVAQSASREQEAQRAGRSWIASAISPPVG
ncbi:hypothetical protein QF035_010710 [Streptomyces umbrinus]|uniref:Uncharacterized protein n=1 Tax=Streptomyces umbrinus TaxID=67370 RepID=A0ABU0TBQ7_9ACTN|nr:hypothetical protein [Streptomyces umbrinus]MDQ1033128.1 hypothetical protein [Streptomyces umbrinus]